jgi:hypothetical protein
VTQKFNSNPMSKAVYRRSFDQAPPDRAAIAEARLDRISSEVRRACNKWLAERSLPTRDGFMGTQPADEPQASPAPTSCDCDGTQPATPPAYREKVQPDATHIASSGILTSPRNFRFSRTTSTPKTT